MKQLRFCMITTFYPPYNFGGDGIGVQRLSRALVRRGHDCTVICNVDAHAALRTGPAPAEEAAEDGVVVHRLTSSLGSLSLLLTQQTGRPVVHGARIRELLDEGRFDVIHYHNISLAGGPGVLAAGDAVKLYTAWEHWLVCPTHVLWRHGREACTERQCFRCVLRHRRPPQLWRHTGFLERQLEHVDAFIALSEFSRRKHHEYDFPREMAVIPGFLPDADAGEPQDLGGTPHPRPYFFFAGRLERLKGLDDVIPVVRSLPDVELLIAGDGQHRPELERLAAGAPKIRFLGHLPLEELGRYYRHAIATLVPTAGYETFGFVVIEAFRHGSPVIARRMGPLPELVERCGGGLTFSTPDELSAALRQLSADAALQRRLGQAGYEGFHRFWTEGAVLPKYFDLIRRVATAKGRARVADSLTKEATV